MTFDEHRRARRDFFENVPHLDAIPSWDWSRIDVPCLGDGGRLDEEAFWLGKEQLWAIREGLAERPDALEAAQEARAGAEQGPDILAPQGPAHGRRRPRRI